MKLFIYSFVVSADSVNCFKNKLDNSTLEEPGYDYQTDIHGTGNRSEVVF